MEIMALGNLVMTGKKHEEEIQYLQKQKRRILRS